jgi:hypothetical protein
MKSLKTFVIATALLSSAQFVQADYKFASTDGSEVSNLCVAAASAAVSLPTFAKANGIRLAELDEVHCNGMPISRFVLKYRSTATSVTADQEKVAGYVLKKTDSSPLTALCAAAVVSKEEFDKVKAEHFSDDSTVESELFCNGEPLKSFARRFRDTAKTLVSQR